MKLMSIEVGALVCGFQLFCKPLYPWRANEAAAAPPEVPLALLTTWWSGATFRVDAPMLFCC